MTPSAAPTQRAAGDASVTAPAAQPGGLDWSAAALGVAMVVAAVLLLHLTRGFTFFYDEWNFLVNRQDLSADSLLEPHNEHNVLVTVLLFRGLWELVGLEHYWVFRALVVGLHLVCVGLLYVYARRRVGPVLALAPAVILLFLGTAWEIILWPFEIQFLIPVAAGIGTLLLLERREAKGDLAASGLLVLALASGSLGIPVLVGAAVEVLLGRDRLRRFLSVVAAPVALYLVWLQVYDPFRARFGTYESVPEFVWEQLGAALAAIAGMSFESARVPALVAASVALVLVAWHLVSSRSDRGRLAAICAMALAYWGALALYRPWVADQEPSRYLYGGALFVLLAAVEIARGRSATRPATAVAAAVVAVSVASNVGDLREGADGIRAYSDYVQPGLGAVEVARDRVAPGFKPEPNRAPDVVAGRYLAAVDRWGSPADSPEEILARPEGPREAADIVLQRALRLELRPAPGPPEAPVAPEPIGSPGGSVTTRDGCLRFDPGGSLAAVELTLPPGGVWLSARAAPVVVQLRRFAHGFLADGAVPGRALFANSRQAFGREVLAAETQQVSPGKSAILSTPPDRAGVPWRARLSTEGSVAACGLARG